MEESFSLNAIELQKYQLIDILLMIDIVSEVLPENMQLDIKT